jgi:hypothetical protein
MLTNNGFASPILPRTADRYFKINAIFGASIFDQIRRGQNITPKLIRFCPPRTHGQAERMNRTIEDTRLRFITIAGHEDLKVGALAFMTASQFAQGKTFEIP